MDISPHRPDWPPVSTVTGTAIMVEPQADDQPTYHGVIRPLKPGDWGDRKPPETG